MTRNLGPIQVDYEMLCFSGNEVKNRPVDDTIDPR